MRALHVGLLALHGVRVNYRIANHVDLAKAEQIREWRQYSTLRELTDQAWLAWGMPLWLQALPLANDFSWMAGSQLDGADLCEAAAALVPMERDW